MAEQEQDPNNRPEWSGAGGSSGHLGRRRGLVNDGGTAGGGPRSRPCRFHRQDAARGGMMSARRRAMNSSPALTEAVRGVWQSLGEPPPGLVVAVSGGCDSVALLRGLAAVRPASSCLVAAHLN